MECILIILWNERNQQPVWSVCDARMGQFFIRFNFSLHGMAWYYLLFISHWLSWRRHIVCWVDYSRFGMLWCDNVLLRLHCTRNCVAILTGVLETTTAIHAYMHTYTIWMDLLMRACVISIISSQQLQWKVLLFWVLRLFSQKEQNNRE